MLHQALHGYSEGHRLLSSSMELGPRDSKMMLMMSDASGPAAVIDEFGYLTGYPLIESGYYAIARTWAAPEMPRPGCVWTHTLLVSFSDIPALDESTKLLGLFRRPLNKDFGYDDELLLPDTPAMAAPLDSNAAARFLWAIYDNPSVPTISSALKQNDRELLVLALWDQQWPRLKRAFRFCTLSFADRSSSGSSFDLQFLPESGRLPRGQFTNAFDIDRAAVLPTDWLMDAVSDLRDGPGGELRQFLKVAGSDVTGREGFAPLVTLYGIFPDLVTEPMSVERAIALMDEKIPEPQGRAARGVVARMAAKTPFELTRSALEFVIKYFDLIDDDDPSISAERIGKALWEADPHALTNLLSDSSARRQIAKRAIAALSVDELAHGAATVPGLVDQILEIRPDLATSHVYWSLPDSWSMASLKRAAEQVDLVPQTIAAMLSSERPAVRDVCTIFGREEVLRSLVGSLGATRHRDKILAEWFSQASSDAVTVARVLSSEKFTDAWPLDSIARVVSPEAIPSDLGDDPWLTAISQLSQEDLTSYLASFLFARALGQQTQRPAQLAKFAFDHLYVAAETSDLPSEAWKLLEDLLERSYFWPAWDRCRRIRHTTVSLFVERKLDPESFASVTVRLEIFALLVDVAASSYEGQRYLEAVLPAVPSGPDRHQRQRIIKGALW